MTPKEKAKELVNKFLQIYDGRVPQAKRCALICADELIKLYEFENPNRGFKISYWDEVKQEINKL